MVRKKLRMRATFITDWARDLYRGLHTSHGHKNKFLLAIFALLIPQIVDAQFGWIPYYWKKPTIRLEAPTLDYPPNNFVFVGSLNQDQDLIFVWIPGRSGVVDAFPGFPRPSLDIGIRPASSSKTYRLCVYENTRCDATGTGIQLVFAPSPASASAIQAFLPYQQLQGKAFQWAVQECISYPVHPAVGARDKSCAWSPSYNLVWQLPRPVQLSTSTGDPRYSHTWHQIFQWSRVQNANNYIVCIASEQSALSACQNNMNPQSGLVYLNPSNPPHVQIGDPPRPFQDSEGQAFYWKVAACSPRNANPPVPAQSLCSDWSQIAGDTWAP